MEFCPNVSLCNGIMFGSIYNCVVPILRSMSCWVSVRRHSGRRVSYPNGIYPNRPLSEWARVLRVTLLRILELLKSRPFIGIFNVYSFKSIVVIFCFTGSWYGDICLANLWSKYIYVSLFDCFVQSEAFSKLFCLQENRLVLKRRNRSEASKPLI